MNVSPVQFRRAGFVDQVKRVLRADPDWTAARLEIEITEGVLLHETDETLATLHRLRGLGVAIAMDDFGTGYSSLGYLQKFRFDKIKIDRSFVQNLQADGHGCGDRACRAPDEPCHGHSRQCRRCRTRMPGGHAAGEGCEEVQGFLFSRAVDAATFSGLLARGAVHEIATPEIATV